MRKIILVCCFLLLLWQRPLQAQTTQPPVYVVRSGDNLYNLALLFGTTVPAIQQANGFTDESIINVGQAIVIPGYPDITGELRLYPIQPGDSLTNVAYRLNLPLPTLTRLNRMVNPNLLYIGQNLIYPAPADSKTDENGNPQWVNTSGTEVVVSPTDSAVGLAAHFQMSKWRLVLSGKLSSPADLFGGKSLLLSTNQPYSRFPSPIKDIHFTPGRLYQGEPIEIRIDLDQPATITGKLVDWTLNFFPYYGGNTQIALQGIYNLQEPGVYPFELQVTLPDGQVRDLRWRARIVDGQRGTQSIAVPNEEFQKLSDTPNIQAEAQRLYSVTKVWNPERYFAGKFQFPVELATDRMTAYFGASRVYNGVSFNSYHAGIDFAGAAGAPILAPASGIVRLAEGLFTRGNAVVIDHGWGIYTCYWHLLRIEVEPGQRVETGQQIGLIGSTGLSNGNHLHWEVWAGGFPVDPLTWVELDYP
ncbi:MAG TPA: peptidoglycan DD-metalloendopeptidase family protein [Anaerolineales bacterium]|nr:peptidoglycan DD-metalloendopeptidase family protein [Anaerolineales bacterium]